MVERSEEGIPWRPQIVRKEKSKGWAIFSQWLWTLYWSREQEKSASETNWPHAFASGEKNFRLTLWPKLQATIFFFNCPFGGALVGRKWGINLDLGFKTLHGAVLRNRNSKPKSLNRWQSYWPRATDSRAFINPDSQQCRCWDYQGQNIEGAHLVRFKGKIGDKKKQQEATKMDQVKLEKNHTKLRE